MKDAHDVMDEAEHGAAEGDVDAAGNSRNHDTRALGDLHRG